MQISTLGKTNLQISRLGAGLSEIGNQLTMADVNQARKVLNAALDGGITFLDTAGCYGISEELIGLTIPHRRHEYILATKCGHAIEESDSDAWTKNTITYSIERSLKRMKTDYIDLIQLHSCNSSILEEGEVITAIQNARDAGKVRFIGYSGDNDAARWAVESGVFDTLQTSFSLVDQHARSKLFPAAKSNGMGIIIKRPIANGAWGVTHSPSKYADSYFQRAQVMATDGPVIGSYWPWADEYIQRSQTMAADGPIPGGPHHEVMLALAFALCHPEVDTAIVGTRNPAHMASNIDMINAGLNIPVETVHELHRRFDVHGQTWEQLT